MVIGVNDKSQIKNEVFRDNRDILEQIVKSDCNQANRNNIGRQFTNKINSANLICIYGSSIGGHPLAPLKITKTTSFDTSSFFAYLSYDKQPPSFKNNYKPANRLIFS